MTRGEISFYQKISLTYLMHLHGCCTEAQSVRRGVLFQANSQAAYRAPKITLTRILVVVTDVHAEPVVDVGVGREPAVGSHAVAGLQNDGHVIERTGQSQPPQLELLLDGPPDRRHDVVLGAVREPYVDADCAAGRSGAESLVRWFQATKAPCLHQPESAHPISPQHSPSTTPGADSRPSSTSPP